MRRLHLLKRAFIFAGVFLVYTLFFVNNVPAPPPPPPPPSAPAGGDVAQAVALGAIVVYGVWKIWKKK